MYTVVQLVLGFKLASRRITAQFGLRYANLLGAPAVWRKGLDKMHKHPPTR